MPKIPLFLGKKNSRSCADCTKCCEGWLTAEIHGEQMYPGKPCQFCQPGVGCSSYDNRPKDPCKTFECMWKAVDDVPIEFKPSEVNAIISKQEINGIPYLVLQEAGEKMRAEVVSWFILYATNNRLNAEWEINGTKNGVGSPAFIQAIQNRK